MQVNIPCLSRQADNMTVTRSPDYSNVQGLSRVRITTLRPLYSTKELRPSLGYRFPLSLELPALIRNLLREKRGKGGEEKYMTVSRQCLERDRLESFSRPKTATTTTSVTKETLAARRNSGRKAQGDIRLRPLSLSLSSSPFFPSLLERKGERLRKRIRRRRRGVVRSRLCKFMQGPPPNERKTQRQLRDPRALNYPGLSATR